MPRKIYYDQSKHRYVRSNSYYGSFWWSSYRKPVPVAPSWRIENKKPSLIHKGKK